jgi:hypothetical protein
MFVACLFRIAGGQWAEQGGYSVVADGGSSNDGEGSFTEFTQIRAPSGWEWVTGWNSIRNRNFDSSGYQYAYGLNSTQYSEKLSVNLFVRRQQWGRKMRYSKRFAPVVMGR